MTNEKSVTCPVCGKTNTTEVKETPAESLFICKDCGANFWKSIERTPEERHLHWISEYKRRGRYEDAASECQEIAQLYEGQGLYDKAREMRDRARQLMGKGPQVILDLNKLIAQVRDGGIVAVYRCPHCGGNLKVDKGTNVEHLKVCEHCGSVIDAMDLADFIRTALS